MTRQHRTPTEVGKFIVDRNMNFEVKMQQLEERFFDALATLIQDRKDTLQHFKQRVKNLHPTSILKKGFAIIKSNNKIITDPKDIKVKSELQTILKNEIIHSTVNKKSKTPQIPLPFRPVLSRRPSSRSAQSAGVPHGIATY